MSQHNSCHWVPNDFTFVLSVLVSYYSYMITWMSDIGQCMEHISKSHNKTNKDRKLSKIIMLERVDALVTQSPPRPSQILFCVGGME